MVCTRSSPRCLCSATRLRESESSTDQSHGNSVLSSLRTRQHYLRSFTFTTLRSSLVRRVHVGYNTKELQCLAFGQVFQLSRHRQSSLPPSRTRDTHLSTWACQFPSCSLASLARRRCVSISRPQPFYRLRSVTASAVHVLLAVLRRPDQVADVLR